MNSLYDRNVRLVAETYLCTKDSPHRIVRVVHDSDEGPQRKQLKVEHMTQPLYFPTVCSGFPNMFCYAGQGTSSSYAVYII